MTFSMLDMAEVGGSATSTEDIGRFDQRTRRKQVALSRSYQERECVVEKWGVDSEEMQSERVREFEGGLRMV